MENKGVPAVVIMPADDYERLVAKEEGKSRKKEQLSLLLDAERFARRTASRHEGEPLPDSVEVLRQLRGRL